MLIVRDHTHKLSLPGGSVEAGENARCAAYRETWEETGLTVQPQTLVTVFDNGFHLFHCVSEATDPRPRPRRPHEIDDAMWLDPAEFARHEWRFADQGEWLARWMDAWQSGHPRP